MKVYVAHATDFDYINKLYKPLRESALNDVHDFFLPHEHDRLENTKDIMKECGMLLAEVSKPSTGEGIEMGRAEAIGLPIVCIYEKGSKPSSALQFVSGTIVEYDGPGDMIEKVGKVLSQL